MENAGASVVRLTEPFVDWDDAFTVILCGTGNNGGDGFVAARYAAGLGAKVLVLLMGNEAHMSESSKLYRHTAEKMGIPVIPVSKAEEGAPYIHEADILVDALIGTGLSSEVKGEKAALIGLVNEARGIIISVDVPSGMMTDTGRAAGVVVDADYTVALGSIKRGHVLYPGSSYTGRLLYSPIGIPKEARLDFPVHLTEKKDVFNILPVRNRISHKGKNGFIGILPVPTAWKEQPFWQARGPFMPAAARWRWSPLPERPGCWQEGFRNLWCLPWEKAPSLRRRMPKEHWKRQRPMM